MLQTVDTTIIHLSRSYRWRLNSTDFMVTVLYGIFEMIVLSKAAQHNSFAFLKAFLCTSATAFQSQEVTMNVFDRKAKRMHRDRAAVHRDRHLFDYLHQEVGSRLADRVYDIKRQFTAGVELGCGRGHVGKHLTRDLLGVLYLCDMSQKMLEEHELDYRLPTFRVIADEEYIPFKNGSVDLFISSLSFHWINDLPGTFRQVNAALKNDGVLIASMFGGDTLFELRSSLQLAELEREGGFAPHVSPFTDVSDLGNLLIRSGFVMLTVDVDEIKVNFPTMFELIWDLQGMAENNASWNRKSHLHRDTMLASAAIYQELYGNRDGTVPATFQILYLIGWKPDISQPKAAKRGSANISLKDLHKTQT